MATLRRRHRLVATLAAICTTRASERAPHVIFALIDDWGSLDAGWREAELGRKVSLNTPTLDALASEGVRLSSYYVQPICTPTRSALLSGRYQIHTGLQDGIIHNLVRVCLPVAFPTMANAFSELGYATHAVGKWHVGAFKSSCLPWNRGFDSFYGFLTGSEMHYTKLQRTPRGNSTDGLGGALYPDFRTEAGPVDAPGCIPPRPDGAAGDAAARARPAEACYSTHMFTRRATELIRAHAASGSAPADSQPADPPPPLFLYLALQAVHEPVEVPRAYSAPYELEILDPVRRNYAGMVSAVDEALANVTGALRAHGMWQNSVLVVSGDNGGWVGYGGLNTPFRGHKATMWEGGVRALGLVVAPGRIARGASFPHLVHVTDWLPTLVRAASGHGVRALGRAYAKLDGVDQWAALRGAGAELGAPPRTELLHNIEGIGGHGPAALRVGKHKLLVNMRKGGFNGWCAPCADPFGCFVPPGAGPGAGEEGRTVPRGGQLCCHAAPPLEERTCAPVPGGAERDASARVSSVLLFDVEADPRELHDLAPEHPALVGELLKQLARHNATNVPCCLCAARLDAEEKALPPKGGAWFTFHDERDDPSELCAMQRLPPYGSTRLLLRPRY